MMDQRQQLISYIYKQIYRNGYIVEQIRSYTNYKHHTSGYMFILRNLYRDWVYLNVDEEIE